MSEEAQLFPQCHSEEAQPTKNLGGGNDRRENLTAEVAGVRRGRLINSILSSDSLTPQR